jgi:hypothetical protein
MTTADFSMNDLASGTLFTYRGPRRWGFRTTLAAGQVVGVDIERGVVFVSTLFESKGQRLQIEIGFLPIVFSCFNSSTLELFGTRLLSEDRFALIQLWRGREALGTAGAFAVPLWEAEKLAWEAVRADDRYISREAFYIEYTFPVPDSHGMFTIVEAAGHRRFRSAENDTSYDQSSE